MSWLRVAAYVGLAFVVAVLALALMLGSARIGTQSDQNGDQQL